MSKLYIISTLTILAIVFGLIAFLNRKKPRAKLSSLAAVSFTFIIGGVVLGENRIIGYGLIGAGILFALADIINKFKKQ